MFSEHAFAPENTFHAIIIRAASNHALCFLFIHDGLLLMSAADAFFTFVAHCVCVTKANQNRSALTRDDGSISSHARLHFSLMRATQIMKSVPTSSVMRVGFYFWSSWFAECIYLEAPKSLGSLFWRRGPFTCFVVRSPSCLDAMRVRDKK